MKVKRVVVVTLLSEQSVVSSVTFCYHLSGGDTKEVPGTRCCSQLFSNGKPNKSCRVKLVP